MTTDRARRVQLQADHDSASEQLARLEAEYAAVLSEPGALQEDRDNVRTLLEAARRAVEETEAAIEQLESGRDGQCQRCGGEIGAERLRALPSATMCVTCQAGA